MGLTSNRMLMMAVLSAVLLFGATVWLWLWLWLCLARRSWRAVGGRIGALLATQAAVFASFCLAANQAFGFYASWADLLGREGGQGVVVDQGSAGAGGPLRVVGTRCPDVPGGSRPSRGGQIQKIELVGRTTRIATSAHVYLPPQYFQPQYRSRTFPAVVVLTGFPGTAEALYKGLHYPQTAHRLARDGKAQPMILVMVRPTVAPPRDTECVEVPNGPQTESFFAEDLPQAVGHHYRVGRGAGSWGVIGNSTGGYCALKLAIHHPGAYAAGAGLSAYYKAPTDHHRRPLPGNDVLRNEADLFWYLRHRPAPDTSLRVTSSKQGESNYGATKDFVKLAASKAPTRISSIILGSGGHNFNTWRREIPPALQWMSGRLSDR